MKFFYMFLMSNKVVNLISIYSQTFFYLNSFQKHSLQGKTLKKEKKLLQNIMNIFFQTVTFALFWTSKLRQSKKQTVYFLFISTSFTEIRFRFRFFFGAEKKFTLKCEVAYWILSCKAPMSFSKDKSRKISLKYNAKTETSKA